MTMIIDFTFSFTNFCVMVCFLTKLLTFGILFSTAVNAELVETSNTRYVTLYLGNFRIEICFFNQVTNIRNFVIRATDFFSKSDLPVSYLAFKEKPVVSMLSTSLTNLLHLVFKQHHFSLRCLILPNLRELVLILQCLIDLLRFLN